MNIVGTALGAAIVLACAVTAVADLTRHPRATAILEHLSIDPRWAPLLGAAKLAVAAGIVVGIWSQAVAIVSGAAAIVYFSGAVAAHVRVRDPFARLFSAAALLWVAALFTLASMAR